MPANVVRALKVTGKIGFLSRNLWHEQFANGEDRWNRRQLLRMTEDEFCLLKPHPNPRAEKCFVLTSRGQHLLEKNNCPVVWPPPVAQLAHDEAIANSLLCLEENGVIASWKMESELKKIQMKEFALNNDPRNKKYPDAIFEILVQNKRWPMALEYERTSKAAFRYRDILWLYSKLVDIKLVVFVCESPIIENTIRGRMKRLALPRLYGRVAFVQIDEWKKDPSNAVLHVEDKSFSLKDFRQKIAASLD